MEQQSDQYSEAYVPMHRSFETLGLDLLLGCCQPTFTQARQPSPLVLPPNTPHRKENVITSARQESQEHF